MGKYKDITGLRCGKLVAQHYCYTNDSRQAVWMVKCDCGNRKKITAKDFMASIARGRNSSCGCNHANVIAGAVGRRFVSSPNVDGGRMMHVSEFAKHVFLAPSTIHNKIAAGKATEWKSEIRYE